ncbi:MAG: peptidylprolyl isomerase [Prevotellaceae bacterium]|nr:peptidylprolyl isomerase [Prevotellaceae bacterium]
MKKILISASFLLATSAVSAQTVMTVAGKPVSLGEFEYAYNKNGGTEGAVEEKTVEEYAQMFLNYKLKVAAAEAMRLDTLQSFKDEFRTYRDMQLTPYMVDQNYIDSVARAVYDNTLQRLDGKDLIHPAHILLRLAPKASEQQRAAAKVRIDSLYAALQDGADFSELARKYSEDPGSRGEGGQLPWIGPGSTIPAFEEAAYALHPGETSRPFESTVGYHIIYMTDRKPFGPYEERSAEIMEMLKAQGIEEASAEHRIDQIVASSAGRLTREAVLDSVLAAHYADDELRYLVQEYHDGLLLYEAAKREVYDPAANDTKALAAWFKAHKQDYAWTEPRFKGVVFHCKDASQVKPLRKMLNKNLSGDWKQIVKQEFNKDSVVVIVSGPYIAKEGENRYVDKLVFKSAPEVKARDGYPYAGYAGKVIKKPEDYTDVKAAVQEDYQASLEKAWVERLRREFDYAVDEAVLKMTKTNR